MNGMKKYEGVIVPAATPFTAKDEIDEAAVCRVIDHLCAAGAAGIFVIGTTGEAPSMTSEQKKKLVEITAEYTGGRAVTYAGISDNCLKNSIQNAETYFNLGIDAVVAHIPWYYSLSDDEIFRFFTMLADGVGGPLMLYNIPKTTGTSISIEIVEKLSNHRRIVGMKDSENNSSRMKEMIEKFSGRKDFSYVLGCAVLSAEAVLRGADGIVPSSANLVPEMYQQLFENARKGNADAAQKLQQRTNRVSLVYQGNRSLSQSLAALKMMMSILGLCEPTVLPPLETLGAAQKAEIENVMIELEVFKAVSKG